MDNKQINNIGELRDYFEQTFQELRGGFITEIDVPEFNYHIDQIAVLFAKEYGQNNAHIKSWLNIIRVIRKDAEKHCNNLFLRKYLLDSLDVIEEKINDFEIPKERKTKDEITFEHFVSPDYKTKKWLIEDVKNLKAKLISMVGIPTQREHLAKTILQNEGKILIIENFSDFIKTLSENEIPKTEIDTVRRKYNLLRNNKLKQDIDAE